MNDRFKFIAWDGVKMWEVKSFDNPYRPEGYYEKQNITEGKHKEWNSVSVWFFNPDKFSTQVIKPIELDKVILMQSTGHKDKNGKLMFESYIYELKVVGIETHIEYIDCVIEWNKSFCALGWKRITKDSEQPQWISIRSKEILDKEYQGNIHEQPELLNELEAEKITPESG